MKKGRRRKNTGERRGFFAWVLFAAYLWVLFYLLFFSETYGRTDPVGEYRYNLELLKEIKRFWYHWETIGIRNVVLNIGGNIAAFAPFGFFLPLLCKKTRNPFVSVGMTAIFSFTVELVQLVTRVGAFDVDDILLNTVGGLIGYLCYLIWDRNK